MGNKSSSSGGRLSLVLDAPPRGNEGGSYIAGQTLTGSLYAASKDAVSTPLDVRAYLSGKEKVRVRYTETEYYTDSKGDRQSRTVTRYRYAERRIVSVPIRLGTVAAGAEAGTRYRFPFSIRLPLDLPSTMHCAENGGGGYCDVVYKVKAELKGRGMFGTKKTEESISVLSAPLPPQPLPYLAEPQTHKVNLCCCFNRGSITFGARVEDTSIGRGDAVAVDFACKNQSTQPIESARVQVVEEVHWHAGAHSNYRRHIVADRSFGETERWRTMEKNEMKEHREKSRGGGTLSHRDRRAEMLRELHHAIHDGENRAELRVATGALHSHEGGLIDVRHRLKIKVQTGSCVDNPKVNVPVRVGTPSRLAASGAAGDGEGEEEPEIPAKAHWDGPAMPPSAPPYEPEIYVKPSAPPAEWADDDGDVPLVTATPVFVGTNVAVLGGNVVEGEEDKGDDGDDEGDAVFAATNVKAEVVPTLPNLLKELEFSVNAVGTVRGRVEDEEWRRGVFDALSPSGYASIIKAVSVEFDQPDVAAAIAPAVKGGNFSSDYLIAALRATSSWLRVTLVQKLLPFCKDMDQ
eukprot:CAMPEP_0113576576 /NCGR_PEP_ID=MMETSP0015_2-20120614/28373_1 /TAXON_ID=2838 /ORGANISM="Odontella" /LENGTH=574 /DNA_ID=CAMNT_0000480027 /DNA_START=21 /DNA_END=1742 /DNA_ORIENTATION=+ /assembly_acc=CAM_ASM_000160